MPSRANTHGAASLARWDARGTSAGTIRALKRRAAKLGLDTSHFTRQRTWTDQALKNAVARASSWTEALGTLGLTGGDARGRLRGHAIRLGLDIGHLEAPHVAEGR